MIKKSLNTIKWQDWLKRRVKSTQSGASKLLIVAIIVFIMAIIMLPLGFAQSGYDQGEDIISAGVNGSSPSGTPTGQYAAGANCKEYNNVRITTYYPGEDAIEGGINAAIGGLAKTVYGYMHGSYTGGANYVSLAGDLDNPDSPFYNPKRSLSAAPNVYIPAVEQYYKQYDPSFTGGIEFKVTDTGGAFKTTGTNHLDLAVVSKPERLLSSAPWNTLYTSQKSFDNTTIYVGTDCSVGAANPILASANGKVPDFKQKDSKWANLVISQYKQTMAEAGCAITSLADVMAANGVATDPGQMLNAANSLGLSGSMGGGLYPYMARKYGLKYIQLDPRSSSQWQQTMTYLKNGALVIAHGGGSGEVAPFTVGGHFVVLTNYNSNGTITVNDPYRPIGPTAYSETLIRNGASTYPDGTVYISIFQK